MFFDGQSEDEAGKNGEWKKDGESHVRGGLGSELTSLVVHVWVERQVPPLLIMFLESRLSSMFVSWICGP